MAGTNSVMWIESPGYGDGSEIQRQDTARHTMHLGVLQLRLQSGRVIEPAKRAQLIRNSPFDGFIHSSGI